MIQDISPHKFQVEYQNLSVKSNDEVLIFSKNQLLVRNQDTLSFMRCDELPELYHEWLTYLFALDEKKYYYIELDEEAVDELCVCGFHLISRQALRTLQPTYLAFVAVTAFQLDGWYHSHHFCGRCASFLKHDEKERMLYCPACGNKIYPRINPAVIVAVVDEDRLLLTKYRGREYKNYALVAGFVEIGESFEDTVRREVMEEAGLQVKNIRYYASQPWAFADNILAGYICEVEGSREIRMEEEELSEARFLSRDEIPEISPDISLTNDMIHAFKQGKF